MLIVMTYVLMASDFFVGSLAVDLLALTMGVITSTRSHPAAKFHGKIACGIWLALFLAGFVQGCQQGFVRGVTGQSMYLPD